MNKNSIKKQILESIKTKEAIIENGLNYIEDAAEVLIESINSSCKILWCGNGGSAADAQHLATELMGGMSDHDRMPIPSIALTTDSSFITAWSNDLDFESIFSRQIQGLGNEGDVLIGISTSGNSKNVVKALEVGNSLKMKTFSILGFDGGKCLSLSNNSIHFQINDMQISEDLQLVVMHMIMKKLSKIKI